MDEDSFFDFFGLSPTVERENRRDIAILKCAYKTTYTLIMQQNASLLPEHTVSDILEELRTLVAPMGKCTKGAQALVWVYFVAAAESLTQAHRTLFKHRLAELHGIGYFGNIPVALATLDKIWALDRRRRWTREAGIVAPVLVI